MQCPDCGCETSSVLDSRYRVDMDGIVRRRGCIDCKTRYTTLEKIIVLPYKGGRTKTTDKRIIKKKRRTI